MRKSKFSALFLAVALTFALGPACGGQGDGGTTTGEGNVRDSGEQNIPSEGGDTGDATEDETAPRGGSDTGDMGGTGEGRGTEGGNVGGTGGGVSP